MRCTRAVSTTACCWLASTKVGISNQAIAHQLLQARRCATASRSSSRAWLTRDWRSCTRSPRALCVASTAVVVVVDVPADHVPLRRGVCRGALRPVVRCVACCDGVRESAIRYLVYGEPEWRAQATKALEQMNCFDPQTKVEFQQTLAWLHEHAVCSPWQIITIHVARSARARTDWARTCRGTSSG